MLQAEPTYLKTLPRAWEIGKAVGLRYVYCGNLRGLFRDHTACYRCGKTLIRRTGFYMKSYRLEQGRCPSCQATSDGVWDNRSRRDGSTESLKEEFHEQCR